MVSGKSTVELIYTQSLSTNNFYIHGLLMFNEWVKRLFLTSFALRFLATKIF